MTEYHVRPLPGDPDRRIRPYRPGFVKNARSSSSFRSTVSGAPHSITLSNPSRNGRTSVLRPMQRFLFAWQQPGSKQAPPSGTRPSKRNRTASHRSACRQSGSNRYFLFGIGQGCRASAVTLRQIGFVSACAYGSADFFVKRPLSFVEERYFYRYFPIGSVCR